jgi:hypothetical protein
VLLKVILFAYSRGTISSRQIERACSENIIFMALSCGFHPDHSTIAQFVSSTQKEIESIFSNILWVWAQLGLLGGTHFSLNGVKLPSNASKEWSGTFKALELTRDKLQARLQQVLNEHIHTASLPGHELEHRQKQEKRLQHQPVAVVCSGAQYRQDPQLQVGSLSLAQERTCQIMIRSKKTKSAVLL